MSTERHGSPSPLVPILFILLLTLIACFSVSFMGPGGLFGWVYEVREKVMIGGTLLATVIGLLWAFRTALVQTLMGMLGATTLIFLSQFQLRVDPVSLFLTNGAYDPAMRIVTAIGIVLVAGFIWNGVFGRREQH